MSLADLVPRDREVAHADYVEGRVIAAPANLADVVGVVIPDFDAHREFVVEGWMPRGDVLPAVGDRCLLVFAGREPWLAAFIP